MDVVADFPADAEEPVQQCDDLLNDPAVDAESGAVVFASAGDMWADVLVALVAVLVGVVGAIGIEIIRARAGDAHAVCAAVG